MTPDQFKSHRIQRGLSQKQWASVLGVSYSSVTKWETDPKSKIPKYVEKLVQSLELGRYKLSKLSEEEQAKLAQRLAENGKTLDEYVSDLIKATLLIVFLLSLAAKLMSGPTDWSGEALAASVGQGFSWFGTAVGYVLGGALELGGALLAAI